MTISEFVKSAAFKSIATGITAVTTILGGMWALDSHYASAAEVEHIQRGFSQQIMQMRADDIDDKIFMLQLKKNSQQGRLDPVDAAMLDRHERQLRSIQNQQAKEAKSQTK